MARRAIRRVRRTGWRGIGVAVGASVLLFVGCYQWAETRHWGAEPQPPTAATPDRLIRVRLGGRDPRRAATAEITAFFSIADFATGRMLSERHEPLSPVTVRPAAGAGIDIGEEHFAGGDLLLNPARDAAIVLEKRTYRGKLRIRRVGDGLTFDNHLDVESYLRGVLRGELPRYFHVESFKAQAVAARTYVLYQKAQAGQDRSFDVFDHEGSQVYVGVRGEDDIAIRAVAATAGEVCVWNDGRSERMFCTYYSSACGGCTQHVNNVKPHVKAVPPLFGGVACTDCSDAPFYRWGLVELTKAEATRRLVERYPDLSRLGTITELEPKTRTPDGRIIRLLLIGSTGTSETLVGEDFRLSIGGRTLKSTNFDIEVRGDKFAFQNGKGFGHGVGLCQHGMEGKARQGMKYKQILKIYYPGSQIKKIY
jgi:stage II sporulation protein D